jgi:hypothetical protein
VAHQVLGFADWSGIENRYAGLQGLTVDDGIHGSYGLNSEIFVELGSNLFGCKVCKDTVGNFGRDWIERQKVREKEREEIRSKAHLCKKGGWKKAG